MTDFNFRRLPYGGADGRTTAEVVNGILDGDINATGTFTCAANAATTVVTDFRAGPSSIILLMPTTANAATETGNGTIFISTRTKQSFTVTHANNTQTDRTFGYLVIG